jgi:GDPmannose 4,6-dehydratase
MKRVLITGMTGQDGRLLAEMLVKKGCAVSGLVRRTYDARCDDIRRRLPTVRLLEGNLQDAESLRGAIDAVRPDEVYNLAGFSAVGRSWQEAEIATDVTGLGVLRILEALRGHTSGDMGSVRFYQASSSEMFGHPRQFPQTELTAFHPRSPYGVAKAFAHYMTINYRESYGAFACCGILYNHESPLRGIHFVTRKITRGAARISLGLQDELVLGNLDVRRDWGHAADYVEAMWMMLQADHPDDYVVATGKTHSLRDLLQVAFERVGISNWTSLIRQDPALIRPAEIAELCGDSTKVRDELGWEPKHTFEQIVHDMVDADVAAERGADPC